jgi:tRNA nucleotidyltransferase (CCA-adding enzyme)
VDAQDASRIGRGQSWLTHAQSIHIYDHHEGDPDATMDTSSDKEKDGKQKATLLELATEVVIDQVGSTTTLLVERLKKAGISPAPHEATLFVLGIRADTGGLVYEGTTIRDAAALLWCLENGASQVAISQFGVAKVSETQRTILHSALGKTETKLVGGLRISSVLVTLEDQYVAGLAQVCEEIMELTDSDVFLLGATHRSGTGNPQKGGRKKKKGDNAENAAVVPPTQWISLIGRASARALGVDLNAMMRQFGGGGHPKAAAAALRCNSCPDLDAATTSIQLPLIADSVVLANEGNLVADETLRLAISIVETQIPEQLVASSFMVPISQIVTVDTNDTIAEARLIFDNHNLKSAPVVDSTAGNNRFRSSLKLNDLVKASRAGRSNEKLKGMLRPSVKTVLPDTNLADLEHLLVNEGIGRIPVVDDDGILVGIVTRTDVLRQHKLYDESNLIDLKLAKD